MRARSGDDLGALGSGRGDDPPRSKARFLSSLTLALAMCLLVASAKSQASSGPDRSIDELARAAGDVKIVVHSRDEYERAADAYRTLIAELDRIEVGTLSPDDAIDHDLLRSHLDIRLFEIEEVRLFEQVPMRYFELSQTDRLLLRPCAANDQVIELAIAELERLPMVLDNARDNLKSPARTWTENAVVIARYAQLLLSDELPAACFLNDELKDQMLAVASPALDAVASFARWLEQELLPRSTRSPAWRPQEIDRYHRVYEKLGYDVDAMLAVASEEEESVRREMTELAKLIHPSGDLRTVWELMKNEAPPWPQVLPMAEWYVEEAADWLESDAQHIIGIPENFDYGTVITTPMARRTLSFGGASYGPTVAGRISGYYVLTPLEEWLSDAEKASRIKAYNPYWTHVISYHEWVGHNVQRAWATNMPDRPARKLFRSAYLSQAWSFYLEKLFEDEGYFERLPHLEALKTRMARLQMRMWRIQRILTKLGMAKGTMTFDEAVQAYVDEIGMERANAFIEVQRDSQSPSSPGREIIGERLILEMRDEYAKRMGQHYQMRSFHEALLSQGELPLPVIRRLLANE